MTKHTPGPWHTDVWNYQNRGERLIVQTDKDAICELGCLYRPDDISAMKGISDEERANGALIAAAPELLNNLQTLLDWMRDHTGPADGAMDIMMDAAATLDKSRGY